MDAALEVNHLVKSYRSGFWQKKQIAVDDISFSIPKGEVFGFLGPNGAGKSTTIKAILGLVQPDQGSISILGQPADEKNARTKVGYLPENPYFYDCISAEELLLFGGKCSGFKGDDLTNRIAALLEKVDLAKFAKNKLRTYSKGMVQRAGLAYALVHEPEIVILDEPMSGLDPFGRKLVGDIIRELKASGKTVFFSSHILNDVETFADRVAIVANKRICLEGPLSSLLSEGQKLEDIFLSTVVSSKG